MFFFCFMGGEAGERRGGKLHARMHACMHAHASVTFHFPYFLGMMFAVCGLFAVRRKAWFGLVGVLIVSLSACVVSWLAGWPAGWLFLFFSFHVLLRRQRTRGIDGGYVVCSCCGMLVSSFLSVCLGSSSFLSAGNT